MKTMRLLTILFLLLICGKVSAQQIHETPSRYPPLYVIDGVLIAGKDVSHMDSTITIHANGKVRIFKTKDIQSVRVLKDPEAMKIYGPKGNHGAIQIVMKK